NLRRVGLPVIGEGELTEGHADKFLRLTPEDLAERTIDAQQPALATGQAHADGCLLEGGPEPLFGVDQRLFRPPQPAAHEGHRLSDEHATRDDVRGRGQAERLYG